ncbi:ArsR/SmtB family transcription factor [Lentzea guizhouensis]|uniref:ArsR/SmtB family transcription factor n=1 Tax=Lentzea guizhouensis TaxID=1586287 RepID=UPI00147291DA|nr:winged helix-turn-helix domain-containing protein [Lentzea guizhouensis]
MHRIHFTAADIARTRLPTGTSRVTETLFALRALRGSGDGLAAWRAEVRKQMRPWFRVLGAISPPAEPCLDLIPLMGPELDDDVLLSRPVSAVREELRWFTRGARALPAVLRGLDDDLGVRAQVLQALRGFHDIAIKPAWATVEAALHADRARQARQMTAGGVGLLLETLHPSMRWDGTTLSIEDTRTVDTELGGQGIEVVPSYFLRKPVLRVDLQDRGRVTLAYPAAVAGAAGERSPRLDRLLGRTRAAVLARIAQGAATTSELARHVGTSAAAVSQHTATLRASGLITTSRHRGTASHTLTATGANLLAQNETQA